MSPRRMIEAELDTDYDQFKEFVRIVLGTKYAALIDEPYRDGPGAPDGNQNASKNKAYVRTDSCEDKPYGNNSAYLRPIFDNYQDLD